MATDSHLNRALLLDVVRRAPMLQALRNAPMDRRDLEEPLEITKSTSHRTTKALAEQGMVRRLVDGRYALTEFGQAVADTVAGFEAAMEANLRLAPVLDAVAGTDPPCPIEAFSGATVTTTDRGDPFAPLARFVTLVRETGSLRMIDSYAIAPTYIDEVHGRILDGLKTEVIERPAIAEDIMRNYPGKCVELCASKFLTMKLHTDLPFGLVLLDHRVGIGVRDPATGAPTAFVDTNADEAREWAEALYDAFSREAILLDKFNPLALREALGSNGK